MAVKPDKWIRRMALEHQMIEPFTDRQVREGVISYGVSSYGYDIRVPGRLSNSRATFASFRPIRSRWPAPSSISASRATC